MANKINVILGLDVSAFERSLGTVQNRMNKLSSQFTAVGSTLTRAFTLPFAAITAGAIKVSADFEQAMSEVKAVSADVTEEGFKQLTEAAKDLGKRTSKSATEAAQGLKFLALAGFDTTQQLAAIEPVLRLAEAGGIELARASDLATDAMSALGIQAEGLGGFLDVVANTSTKANSSIEQLNEAFIAVGGQFKNLNVPIDESNALLGILANRGIKGSEAGNGLNAVLINLTTGAGKAGKAMDQLGISAFDSEGNFRGVSTILKDLNAKFATMTTEQQTTYKAMLGGKNRITELNALLDGMSNEFDGLRDSIQDSEGKLLDIAEVMQDNLKGQVTRLKSALEGLGIQMGEVLLPIVKRVADGLQAFVDLLSKASPQMVRVALAIGAVLAAIGPLLLALGAATKFIASAAGGLKLLAGGLTFLTGPVGIAIAAIAALVAGIVIAYNRSEEFRDVVRRVGQVIQFIFAKAVEVARDQFTRLKAALEAARPVLSKVVEVVRAIANAWFQVQKVVLTIATRVLAFFVAAWVGAVNSIQKVVFQFFTEFRNNLKAFGTAFEELKKGNVKAAITSLGKELANDGRNVGEAFTGGFKEGFDGTLNFFKGIQDAFNRDSAKTGETVAKNIAAGAQRGLQQVQEAGAQAAGGTGARQPARIRQETAALSTLPADISALQNFARDKSIELKTNTLATAMESLKARASAAFQATTEEARKTQLATEEFLNSLNLGLLKSGDTFVNWQQIASSSIVRGLDSISQSIEGGISSFKSLAQAVRKSIQAIISDLIKQGVAAIITGTLVNLGVKLGPFALAAAAAAGAAASGLFNTALNKIAPPKLAQGGLTRGATLAVVGDNPSGKEAIIPFERMDEFLSKFGGGGGTRVTGVFEVKGSDLVLVLDRARQEQTRIR
jgi:TP901 family phage tail tape measure protein